MTQSAVHAQVIDILEHINSENASGKTFLRQISQSPRRFHLAMLLVMVWGIVFMSLSAMLVLPLPDPIVGVMSRFSVNSPILYSFQIPVAILVAAMLGRSYGLLTMFLYLVAGFAGLPLFAGGGGLHYLGQMTSGYLLAFLILPIILHQPMQRAYRHTGWFKGRSLWLFVAALSGVLLVHAVGALGIAIHLVTGKLSLPETGNWLLHSSGPSVIYDILFAALAVGSVRIVRALFWFCLY